MASPTAKLLSITPEALEAATLEQQTAIWELLASCRELHVMTASLYALPADYLSIDIVYGVRANAIAGGIDPEGRVST